MDNSEEFSQQLNERMPLAMRAMEKATGKTSKELRKMMEEGKLGLDVLPKFGRALRELSNENKALDKAILTARVQENRLIQQFQKSADKVFRSGFEEGLVTFYKSLSEELKSTGKAQEDLGNIYGNFFKLLARAIKLVTPLLEAALNVVSKLTDAVMLSVRGWEMMPAPIKAAAAAFILLNSSMARVMAKGVLLLALFQEVASLFDDKLVGALEAQMGTQFNLKTLQQTGLEKRNGQFFSTGESQSMLGTTEGKAVIAGAGVAALAGLTPLFRTLIEVIKNLTKAIMGKSVLESGKSFSTKKGKSSGAAKAFAAGTLAMGVKTGAKSLSGAGALLMPANEKHPVGLSTIDPLDVRRMPEGKSFDLSSFKSNRDLHELNNRQMMIQRNLGGQRMSPVHNEIKPQITVNIDGSNLNSEEAGRMIATTAMEALERDIATAMRGGHY